MIVIGVPTERKRMKQVTENKELKDKLKVRYENHGFDGEKDIIVPIMYDPDTGNIYDVGDIYDIKGEEDVHGIEQVKVQDQ
tara:strand:+ start:724 stop:966 length:243 start_codon:yes stop_codon:yes gene_type:complete